MFYKYGSTTKTVILGRLLNDSEGYVELVSGNDNKYLISKEFVVSLEPTDYDFVDSSERKRGVS